MIETKYHTFEKSPYNEVEHEGELKITLIYSNTVTLHQEVRDEEAIKMKLIMEAQEILDKASNNFYIENIEYITQ